jgi:hypothetical protein
LSGGSKISGFSSETLENTDSDEGKKSLKLISLGSHESLLEMNSYEILPTTMEVSHVNSLVFDDELKLSE